MRDLNEDTYKIRHTLISNNKYVLEVLQNKNWSYFIEKILEVSQGDISLLNISGVDQNIKIINGTSDNLAVCKESYSYFYSNIGCAFQRFLQATYKKHIENIEKDLARNLYFIDLKNEQNAKNNVQVFVEFFFIFGRFPGIIDHLPIIPTMETSSFVKENEIISPS